MRNLLEKSIKIRKENETEPLAETKSSVFRAIVGNSLAKYGHSAHMVRSVFSYLEGLLVKQQ